MKARTLSRSDVERAIQHSKSNRSAAKYLGVHLITYRKYARMYLDEPTGLNLYDKHNNQSGLGIRKHLKNHPENNQNILMDILEGKVIPSNFTPERLKSRLIKEALLEEKCACCNFNERRVHDYKVPLLLTFRDGDKRNWKQNNLELLCYNCYFLQVGEVFNKKQLIAIEDMHRPKGSDIQKELQIEDNHIYILEDEYKNNSVYSPPEEDNTGESLLFKM